MPKFRIAPEIYIFAAAALLLIPVRFLAAVTIAVTVHEFGHWAALRLLGVEISAIEILPGGCVMKTGGLTAGGEAVCALAGPAAGGMLLLFARWLPLTAICACIHTLYNLIPVYPLDGGRVMRGSLCLLMGDETGKRVCACVETLVVGLLLAVGILSSFILNMGVTPLLVASVLCLRVLFRKIPCKKKALAVQ